MADQIALVQLSAACAVRNAVHRVAQLTMIVGAIVLAAAVPAHAAPKPICGRDDARTERAGQLVRVFSRPHRPRGDRVFYACARGYESHRLGSRHFEDGTPAGGLARYAIAGPFIAYGTDSGFNDFGNSSADARTMDLRTGRLVMRPLGLGADYAENGTFDRIDVDKQGHAAWTMRHEPTNLPGTAARPAGVAVYRDPRCGPTLLADIATGSTEAFTASTRLDLRRGALSWTVDGVDGRAPLCSRP